MILLECSIGVLIETREICHGKSYRESVDTFNDQSVAPGEEPRKFDSTGMFHWCPNRKLEKSVMVSPIENL